MALTGAVAGRMVDIEINVDASFDRFVAAGVFISVLEGASGLSVHALWPVPQETEAIRASIGRPELSEQARAESRL